MCLKSIPRDKRVHFPYPTKVGKDFGAGGADRDVVGLVMEPSVHLKFLRGTKKPIALITREQRVVLQKD